MTTPPLRHESSASAGGILFQVHRVLALLTTESHASRVGFEVFGDAVVDLLDGQRKVEEDKSSTTGLALTDEDVAIWNTLKNWIDIHRKLDVESQNKTSLCIVTTRNPGQRSRFVEELGRPNKSFAQVADCMHQMAGIHERRTEKRKRAGAHPEPDQMDFVQAPENDAARLWVVGRMAIVFGADPVSAAEQAALARQMLLTPEEDHGRVIDAVSGWLLKEISRSIRDGQKCWIQRENYTRAVQAARPPAKPVRIRPMNTIGHEDRDSAARTFVPHRFVEKLKAIRVSEATILDATQHHLNHHAELLYLTHSGAILYGLDDTKSSDAERFYSELQDRWRDAYLRELDGAAAGDDKAKTGARIFYRSLDSARSQALSIGRIPVEQVYFTHGGLHALANNDIDGHDIWWMPTDELDAPVSLGTAPR